MERIIFRIEKNPYNQSIRCTNQKKGESWAETLCNPEYNFLAIFPDDETNPGMVECLPFFFDGHGVAHFEPLTEMCMEYYYTKTKIIHKRDARCETLLKTVSEYYEGTPFSVAEKLTH